MKYLLSIVVISFSVVLALSSCRDQQSSIGTGSVRIVRQEGNYVLYRNGRPFPIRGAAGSSHLSELQKAGGNAIRVWDTLHLASILDSAQLNHLAVIVGLPIPNNDDYMSYYNDSAKVAAQFRACKAIVNRFKAHPAVLMWCVGNELSFPVRLSYNNFYKAFNELVDMIHHDDPDHLVTTTLLNFDKKYIVALKLRCNIDVISFNIFSRIKDLRDDLKSFAWIWNGPFLLTEWGLDGPWLGSAQTAWGAYIENTSTKKAEVILNRYRKDIPTDDPRLLGTFVFFWGQKQETTPTWFSIFDETGARSELVNTMHTIWTGKPGPWTVPAVQYMLVNQKGARDNIVLTPGQGASAEVLMASLPDSVKAVDWQIYREDWYKENNINNTQKPTPLPLFTAKNKLKATFTAPTVEGPYRLFATIYNKRGGFAACNTPFYVVKKP